MVVSQERKKSKPKKAPRRVSGGVHLNIPFKKSAVVTHTEVAQKVKGRVLTKLTKIVVPIAPSGPSNPPDPLPTPSDQDAPAPSKQPCKGPSRSAAVSLLNLQF